MCSLLPSLSEGMELWALCSWDAPNSGAQHSTPLSPSSLQVWETPISGTCQIRLPPAVSEERKQFGSPGEHCLPEKENTCSQRPAVPELAKNPEVRKLNCACLPSLFPAALRREGNRCHPFKTSMSVTTTAWTKPDVISRAVKPDNSQTEELGSVAWGSPVACCASWNEDLRLTTQSSVNLPSAQKSPSSSWHLWEKTLHTLRLCWVTRKGNCSSSLMIQEAQQCCNLKIGAWFQISKSSPSCSSIRWCLWK